MSPTRAMALPVTSSKTSWTSSVFATPIPNEPMTGSFRPETITAVLAALYRGHEEMLSIT